MLCHGMLLRTDYIVFRYFIRLVWLYHVMMYFPSPYFALLSFNWCCKWFCVTLRYFILRDFPSLHLMSHDFKLLYVCCSLPYFTSLYFSLHYCTSLHFSSLYFPTLLYFTVPFFISPYLTLLSFFFTLLDFTRYFILLYCTPYFTVHLILIYSILYFTLSPTAESTMG